MSEEKELEKELEAEVLAELEKEMKELSVPVSIASPEYPQLMARLNEMDDRVEFVAGELWQRQGEKLGLTMGLLYGALIGIVTYVLFMI
ncbi:MAG TPA: tetrahydromethanopterin S-methyltransferase subunit G [Methanomicrobia archaeon]|nr:tetrahydromethanopterin S-methyltransferase subunit G [Methanomicrobia archaeon]